VSKASDPSQRFAPSKAYTAETIQVLEGREAVRKRPAMYISNTDALGLHHLVFEVIDNSIDESLAGFCDHISLTLHFDNSVTISDNGRGIPVEEHPTQKGKSTVEVVHTILHSGGKFEKDVYKYSGGLHGVGVSVVNFLSEWLEVEVLRNGHVWLQRFERGLPAGPLRPIGDSKRTGTTTRFRPDPQILTTTEFSFETLSSRLRELAFLTAGVRIDIQDERSGKRHSFKFDGGIVEFVRHINRDREVIHPKPIYVQKSRTYERLGGGEEEIHLELALQYNDTYDELLLSFANNIRTRDGGTHVSGFRRALTRAVNDYARKADLARKLSAGLSGEDLREGLTAILSLKIKDPQFEGQNKGKLLNAEIEGQVHSLVYDALVEFFEEHPKEARAITQKVILAAEARLAARKAREIVRKSAMEITALPGKLTDCSEKDPEMTELYLVEGESAGGSAIQGRDRHFQAILPLKGKILNVEKARIDKVLSNEEIRHVITALGTGIGDGFDIAKLRYGKIILMTDADVDGAHIRTLLLTFFFRRLRDLVEQGKIFIAQPPLYRVRKGKADRYLDTDEQKDRFLLDMGLEGTSLFVRSEPKDKKKAPQEAELTKAQLRSLTEAVVEIEGLGRILERKGLALEELFAQRDKRGFPVYMVNLPNAERRFAYDEKDLGRLIKELEAAAGNGNGGAKHSEGGQADSLADAEEEEEEPVVKHDIVELTESKRIGELLGAIEKLGIGLDQYHPRPRYFGNGAANGAPKFRLVNEKTEMEAPSLLEAIEGLKGLGSRGMTIQRYKGLGEMNPEQLWETTMNPATRRLLRVTTEDAEEADLIFSRLMGDNVDTRRAFIQRHAPEVRNLDI